MQKRDPLSTSETMQPPTSPRLKPSVPYCLGAGCTRGLAGWVSDASMVPAVDTFIDMPFSVLTLHALQCLNTSTSSDGVGPSARSVGVYLDRKPRLSQLLSFSVERSA